MNYNPYAAPQAGPPQAPTSPGAGTPQPWEIGEVISQAWATFKIHWAVLLFAMILAGILEMIPGAIINGVTGASAGFASGMAGRAAPQSLDEILAASVTASALVGQLVNQFVAAFFQVGLLRINIVAARGGTPTFADLFSGGTKFLPLFVLNIVLGISIALGFLFLIVPGVILYCGLWASSYFLVDADVGIGDALKGSWSANTGHKLNIFLFGLVCVLINLGGALACCVGLLVTAPLTTLALAIVFVRISGRGATALPQGAAPGGGYPPGGYGGPPGGYGGPPGGAPPGYGGPPPGAPPGGGGYGGPPPGGGGYGGPPPGGGGYGPPPGGGGGYGPPGGGGYGGR